VFISRRACIEADETGVLLINTARGALVDGDAMTRRAVGPRSGCGLDASPPPPPPPKKSNPCGIIP